LLSECRVDRAGDRVQGVLTPRRVRLVALFVALEVGLAPATVPVVQALL